MTTKKKTTATKTKTNKAPARKASATKVKAAPAKPPKAKRASGDAKPKKLSALDAAATLLAQSSAAMNCKELVEAMAAQGLWSSPGGKTPHATLYSAILREIKAKGNDARFTKTERGKFTAKS